MYFLIMITPKHPIATGSDDKLPSTNSRENVVMSYIPYDLGRNHSER